MFNYIIIINNSVENNHPFDTENAIPTTINYLLRRYLIDAIPDMYASNYYNSIYNNIVECINNKSASKNQSFKSK